MANLNERNQQILGLLNLAGGSLRGFGVSKTSEKKGSSPYARNSEAARAGIRKWGIEKPSMTYIGMTAPAVFSKVLPDAKAVLEKLITLRAERINQPGIQLATSNVNRYGIGATVKKPYSAAFGDVSISFIGDASGVIHQFFYMWLNSIVATHDVASGGANVDPFLKHPFEVEYRDNYRTTIQIITYDEIQQQIGTISLFNAYPTALGEIQRDWAGVNDLVRIPVQFTYSHWAYVSQLDVNLIEPNRQRLSESNMSLVDNIIKGATVMQTLTSIKRPQNVNDVLNVVNSGSTLLRSFIQPINY